MVGAAPKPSTLLLFVSQQHQKALMGPIVLVIALMLMSLPLSRAACYQGRQAQGVGEGKKRHDNLFQVIATNKAAVSDQLASPQQCQKGLAVSSSCS